MYFTNAIPMNEKIVIGANSSTELFLPILSAITAASIAPKTQPPKGATAHHDPSILVVGIVDELETRYGRYGELQPVFMPKDITAIEAEKREPILILG